MLKLIDTMPGLSVYEHNTGRGVIITDKKKGGKNGAIFDTPKQALEVALAALWGAPLTLTHTFRPQPKAAENV